MRLEDSFASVAPRSSTTRTNAAPSNVEGFRTTLYADDRKSAAEDDRRRTAPAKNERDQDGTDDVSETALRARDQDLGQEEDERISEAIDVLAFGAREASIRLELTETAKTLQDEKTPRTPFGQSATHPISSIPETNEGRVSDAAETLSADMNVLDIVSRGKLGEVNQLATQHSTDRSQTVVESRIAHNLNELALTKDAFQQKKPLSKTDGNAVLKNLAFSTPASDLMAEYQGKTQRIFDASPLGSIITPEQSADQSGIDSTSTPSLKHAELPVETAQRIFSQISSEIEKFPRPQAFQQPSSIYSSMSMDILNRKIQNMIQFSLEPVELGKVRMQFFQSENGLQISIIAERLETLELMKRNSEMLTKDLERLGLQNFSLSFSDKEKNAKDSEERNSTFLTEAAAASAGSEMEEFDKLTYKSPLGTVDIRV